jgi:ADP-ribose pyrophosphatase YjhB (NUDIX family)
MVADDPLQLIEATELEREHGVPQSARHSSRQQPRQEVPVEPGLGAWDLPAGYLDPGESFEEGARRETREEAGIEVELTALAGVYHSPWVNAVTVVYRARATDATSEVRIDFESSDHAWVPRSAVPDWLPRIAFPAMAAAVADWAAGRIGGPSAGD